MRRALLALILSLGIAASSQAALTLVSRETFQGVGTLDSGTPGNLGTVNSGSFYKRAVGPRVTSDTTANSLGWSADLRQVASTATIVRHDVTTTSTAAAALGTFSCWYYFNSFQNSGANKQFLTSTHVANSNQLVRCIIDATTGNFWYNKNPGFTDTDSTVAVPVRQWFELRNSWQLVSGTTYNVSLDYRLAGSSSWVNIMSASGGNASSLMATVRAGAPNSANSTGLFVGRYAMPSLYALGAWSDRTALVSDVVDPTGPTTWYVNPSTGSDSNDGVTAASPWATAAKVNTETQFGGFFAAASYGAGDTLVIDTSGAVLDLLGTALTFTTQGLNIRAATGQTWAVIKPWKTLAPGDWTSVGGGVYSTTNAVALCTVWEDDKWLTHPAGANYAAVSATLASTAGSFYVDTATATLYIHPFGSTDPRSDGKTYTRSHIIAAAVNLNAANVNVQDLYIRKTCDTDPSTHLSNGGYGIGTGGAWSGTNLIKHCYTDYSGKHGFGLVANSLAGEVTTIESCEAEQGSAYGSQTPFVSFNGTSVTNLSHYYVNCVSTVDSGLVGSAAGVSGVAQSIYSHNTSGSNQFALISVDGCNFANSSIGTTNAVVALTINNTIFGGDNASGATTKTITRSKWTKYVPNQNRSDGTITVRNCLIVPVKSNYNDNDGAMIGTAVIEGNTYDFTNCSVSVSTAGVLTRTGASTVTFRNNAILFPVAGGSTTFSIFKSFVNTDALTITNNAVLLNGSTWAKSYNDGGTTADRNFTQWQALGFDANSASVSSLMVDANYKPLAGSPLIRAGVNIGPLTDYAGLKTFSPRDTIGAYQFDGIFLLGRSLLFPLSR